MLIQRLTGRFKLPLGIFLSVFAMVLTGYWYFFHKNVRTDTKPITVETILVRKGPIDHTLPAIGILQSNESVLIRPEVSGRIASILFTEGQHVEKGQTLIKLEDSIAKANVKESQAEFLLRKLEFGRMETLLKRSAISVTDKDTAFSKLEASEASLVKAQTMLDKMTISAPFEGYVGIRKVNTGDYVSPGQELVNIVDLTPIKIAFRIPEVYLEKVKLEQTVSVTTDALPNRIFIGKIYAIDPQIDPIGHSILMTAIIDNDQLLLRPGLFARVDVHLDHQDNALFIPVEALMPQEQKQFVYRIENNTAILTEIKTGVREQNEVEVLSGLKAGDVVITAGQIKVEHGSKINPLPSSQKQDLQ